MAFKNILAKNINTNEIYENTRIDSLLFKTIKKKKTYYNFNSKEFDLLEIDKTDQDYINSKLNIVKEDKKKEVLNYYNSDECFTFTLKDKDNNSITKKHNWFLEKLSTKPFFISDSGQLIEKNISIENVFNIKNLINNIGIKLNLKLNEINATIETFNDLEKLNTFNPIEELKNVDKIINIDNIAK